MRIDFKLNRRRKCTKNPGIKKILQEHVNYVLTKFIKGWQQKHVGLKAKRYEFLDKRSQAVYLKS
jgi:hypothetical protein